MVRIPLIALSAVLLWLAAQPAGGQELSKRHLETRLNTHFRFCDLAFHEYVNHMRTVISKTRVDLSAKQRFQIIDANSPFEWRPRSPECIKLNRPRFKNGVLLIHGLTDSPYLMRDVGKFFLDRCFLVRPILPPGHGTVPGDLLEVNYKAWIEASRYGIDRFIDLQQVERLYLVGFSTGGALSIYLGLKQEPVKALILFSPAVKIKSNLGFMANWHKAVSWAAKNKEWMDIAADEDYAKYESSTFNAADRIYLLTQLLENEAEKGLLDIPMFMALSEDDATVDSEDALDFSRSKAIRTAAWCSTPTVWVRRTTSEFSQGRALILTRVS